jgi:hypothetical protein
MDAISTAAAGMAAASARFDDAAGRLARSGAGDDQAMAQAAVASIQTEAAFAADTKVVKAADQMMGALLDVTA